ncbi:MAG: hypothetical protein ACRDRL_23285 [Sciscionella sp.]
MKTHQVGLAVADGADVDPVTGRLLSVAELQAALRLARSAPRSPALLSPPSLLSPPTPSAARVQVTGASAPASAATSRGDVADLRVVAVLAAHPGAGASTVALAIAEAVAPHRQVRLLECADGTRSGLAAASTEELGVDAAGWRHGRRGHLDVHRLAGCVRSIDKLPAPPTSPELARGEAGLLVVDVGWPARDALEVTGWLGDLITAGLPVVVCRASVPGMHHAEQVLAQLGRPSLIAAIGPAHSSSAVTASCGPLLRQARADGRVVRVPTNRRLEATGVTTDPLPKPVVAAGKALGSRMFADQPDLRAGDNK